MYTEVRLSSDSMELIEEMLLMRDCETCIFSIDNPNTKQECYCGDGPNYCEQLKRELGLS